MELADMFLVIGEKCQELKELGCHPFFEYSGHVNSFSVRCYRNWSNNHLAADFWIRSDDFESLGDFIEEFLKKSNSLIALL